MKAFFLFQYFLRFAAIALFALVFGCSQEAPLAFRVGINAWPGYEFIYLAQEKGFYKDESLDIRIIELSSLSDARRAYERGQIHALGTTVVDVLQIRDQSKRSPQIIQVVDYSDGADVILAQPEITNVSTLRGKRIGVELASLGVYVLARALENNGLELSDVEMVSMDQLSMESAFIEREIAAIVSYPPVSVRLKRLGKAVTVFSSSDIAKEVIDVDRQSVVSEGFRDKKNSIPSFTANTSIELPTPAASVFASSSI